MDIQMSKDLNYVFNALTTHDAIKRHSSAVMGYVCLFGVTPFHLKAPKFRRIMEEMVKLFDAQAFSYQKKTYSISHAGIIEALDICIKKNFGEVLENHNYLKKVMIGISEREGKGKSKQDEKDLRIREGKMLNGYDRTYLRPDPDGDNEDVGEETPVRVYREPTQTTVRPDRGVPEPLSSVAQKAINDLKKRWGEKT
jgi:hypothetical protein